jgi:uncharacterized membrane protein YqhA
MHRALLSLRIVMLAASAGAMLGALLLFGIGGAKIAGAFRAALAGGADPKVATALVLAATDTFLFGVVLVIFAYAIAFGFVLQPPPAVRARMPGWMRIGGIGELKHTLVGVIVVYLVVDFATDLAERDAQPSWDALVVPASLVLIAGAMRLLGYGHAEAGSEPAGRHADGGPS